MSRKPIRAAIIGCGFIAEKHVRSMAECGPEEVELAALCDIDPQRLAGFAEKTGLSDRPGFGMYTDVEECLRREEVELVVITTSSATHASLALAALRSGKHVLTEKPHALTLEDAEAMAAAAKRSGRVLAVSLQARYMPQVQAVKKAVGEGRFGPLVHGSVSMRWNRDMSYYAAAPWRDSLARGGGLFMNQCIHYIDLLQWFMGPAVSVYAQAGTFLQPLQVENMGAVILTFANGAIGVIEGSSCVYPRSLLTSVSVFGGTGSVTLEGGKLDDIRSWAFAKDPGGMDAVGLPAVGEISHTPLYKDLLQAIRSGGTPLVSIETAAHSLEIVLAIYQSIEENRAVSLPFMSTPGAGQAMNKGGDAG